MGRVEVGYNPKPLSVKSGRATFTAPSFRYIRGLALAHVGVLVTRLVYCYKILDFPVSVIAVSMM
jgi:hypothetical protein